MNNGIDISGSLVCEEKRFHAVAPPVNGMDEIGEYYDTLDEFSKELIKLNMSAAECGASKKMISNKVTRLSEQFYYLCAGSSGRLGRPKEESPKVVEKIIEKVVEVPVEKIVEKIVEVPAKPKPEEIPDNFMREERGWGVCPICGKRLLKLTNSTVIKNMSMYCKMCRAEYIVSWWNVKDKDFHYKRYVNHEYFFQHDDIYSEALKGNGVGTYRRTGRSSTEHVAVHLGRG